MDKDEHKALKLWGDVASNLATKTEPAGIDRGRMSVNVIDEAILYHLTFYKRKYIEKINLLLGKHTVKDIVFRVANVRNKVERAADKARQVALQIMPYREYLQTAEWKERREQLLRCVLYRCQICNTGNVSLHVHHRTYERRGNEHFTDLIVLCKDCHALYHEQGKLPVDGFDKV